MALIFLGSMASSSCMAFHWSRISCFRITAFNEPSERLDLQLYQPNIADLRCSLQLGKSGVILKSFADRSLAMRVSSLRVSLHL